MSENGSEIQLLHNGAVSTGGETPEVWTEGAVAWSGSRIVAVGSEDDLRKEFPQAERLQGKIQGISYRGLRTPNRDVCSYVATVGDSVVVTNSPVQLRRIIDVHRGNHPALATLDEYKYFRDRYPLGDDAETGLLIISDKTIRRWCGPRWRIATSRRTRAAAVMVEADYRMKLVGMGIEEGTPGVKSYLDLIEIPPGGTPPPMSVLRWWFALKYDAVLSEPSRRAFRFDGLDLRGPRACRSST